MAHAPFTPQGGVGVEDRDQRLDIGDMQALRLCDSWATRLNSLFIRRRRTAKDCNPVAPSGGSET
mgnify:CR=1 FL=1